MSLLMHEQITHRFQHTVFFVNRENGWITAERITGSCHYPQRKGQRTKHQNVGPPIAAHCTPPVRPDALGCCISVTNHGHFCTESPSKRSEQWAVARPLVAALWLRFLQPEADCNCSGGASASTIGTVCVCCMYHGQGKRAGDQLSFALTRSRLFFAFVRKRGKRSVCGAPGLCSGCECVRAVCF